ncbi:MAG: DNA-protecting protein DprA [Saprospiraceae bacterium]|nr:DNA-protecting protein DprA [Saprospiraceae bacterium]MBK6564882.1 DNA-protecting protein DprA [Saprospiraceae bacterium]MBK7523526.1 DNA-protecting protein DprA [Saprospiraceae bacterium]MBK8371486.1 DNA-protecting protein DprA [Saprospiraceae bacterium]MBK8548750.1 DNA-protecting protein DprA [Saprospiraceae bacterium]
MKDEELLLLLTLTKIPKVGVIVAKNLISYCGSVEAVFSEPLKNLMKIPSVGESIARNIREADFRRTESELKFIHQNQITTSAYYQSDYPHRIKQFDDCPVLLFYKGQNILNHTRTVGIVGTRTPTEYGKKTCEKIMESLAKYNPLIISGLAYGIDSIAHKKSLTLSLPTVGVLGHGLDIMYPAPNRSLAEKMLHSGGLLTEFPSQTKPDKENFPMRNRIIAALSDVIVVIESRKKGGSIITAELANDYNKDVFAVPGRLNDDLSEGCNNLIKQNKAHLIESADDIGYIMRWEEMDTRKFIQTSLFVELDETEKEVVNLLKQEQELTIDQITYRLRKQPSEVSSLMVNMEFKSVVRCLPGKKYILF